MGPFQLQMDDSGKGSYALGDMGNASQGGEGARPSLAGPAPRYSSGPPASSVRTAAPAQPATRKMTPDEMSAWADKKLAEIRAQSKASLDAGPSVRRMESGTPETNYETELTPGAEQAYQRFIGRMTSQQPQLGERLSADNTGQDYDYRGAFAAGQGESPNGHWTDQYKKPNHETFSDESQYASYGNPGHWEGDTYQAPPPRNAPADAEGPRQDVESLGSSGQYNQDSPDYNFIHSPSPLNVASALQTDRHAISPGTEDYMRREGMWTDKTDALLRSRGLYPPSVTQYDPMDPDVRAEGGSMGSGEPYLVGEKGPELIGPNEPGWVMTAHQTAALLGAPPTKQQAEHLERMGHARFGGGMVMPQVRSAPAVPQQMPFQMLGGSVPAGPPVSVGRPPPPQQMPAAGPMMARLPTREDGGPVEAIGFHAQRPGTPPPGKQLSPAELALLRSTGAGTSGAATPSRQLSEAEKAQLRSVGANAREEGGPVGKDGLTEKIGKSIAGAIDSSPTVSGALQSYGDWVSQPHSLPAPIQHVADYGGSLYDRAQAGVSRAADYVGGALGFETQAQKEREAQMAEMDEHMRNLKAAQAASDPRAKQLGGVHDNEVAEFLDETPAVAYRYNDSSFEPNAQRPGERQVGFLTSDLKKTPMGAAIVEKRPDGYEGYNQHRMIGAMFAGERNLHERLRDLEAIIAEHTGKK
jgi:hypothetical protein